jgi:hypothetical protein
VSEQLLGGVQKSSAQHDSGEAQLLLQNGRRGNEHPFAPEKLDSEDKARTFRSRRRLPCNYQVRAISAAYSSEFERAA